MLCLPLAGCLLILLKSRQKNKKLFQDLDLPRGHFKIVFLKSAYRHNLFVIKPLKTHSVLNY
jgi:hypothetical protein